MSSYLTISVFMLPIAKSNDTHRLSDKLCLHRLPPILGVPKALQDESHVCDQSHHNDQPSCQRLTLVGKKSSSDVSRFTNKWCLKVRRALGTSLVLPLICVLLVTQERTPNVAPNATINVIRPLNASKCKCHFDNHNDCNFHNNCDVSSHAQDYCLIATE